MTTRSVLRKFINKHRNWAFEDMPVVDSIGFHDVSVISVLDCRVGSQGRVRDVGVFMIDGKQYEVAHWVEFGWDEGPSNNPEYRQCKLIGGAP